MREKKKILAKTNASETTPTNMALNSSAQGTLGDMHGTIEPVNFVLDPLVVIGGRYVLFLKQKYSIALLVLFCLFCLVTHWLLFSISSFLFVSLVSSFSCLSPFISLSLSCVYSVSISYFFSLPLIFLLYFFCLTLKFISLSYFSVSLSYPLIPISYSSVFLSYFFVSFIFF